MAMCAVACTYPWQWYVCSDVMQSCRSAMFFSFCTTSFDQGQLGFRIKMTIEHHDNAVVQPVTSLLID
jgi:hypothetical protein